MSAVTARNGARLNKDAYKKLIAEDIAWLEEQPRTLERDHTIDVLRWSIDALYSKHDLRMFGGGACSNGHPIAANAAGCDEECDK